jgi:hypothetical protein
MQAYNLLEQTIYYFQTSTGGLFEIERGKRLFLIPV